MRGPFDRPAATRLALAVLAALAGALACAIGGVVGPATARAQDASAGRAALARYGCVSCHAEPAASLGQGARCVGCHVEVLRGRRSGLGRAPAVRHYIDVPSLVSAGRRMRPDALAAYVRDPIHLRPRMDESMPRLPVTEADANAIAAYLRTASGARTAPRSPAPDRSRVEAGRRAYQAAGCVTCHSFGTAIPALALPREALRAMGAQSVLGPDLRFACDLIDPDTALAWILDPQSVDNDARMPRTPLRPADALAIRDFLFLGDPGAPARPPRVVTADDLAPLARPVRFAEVRRIFGRSCIHCHAHTTGDQASAVFGFARSALDLSSYEGVSAGVVLPDGTRRSVVADDASGTAPLVARLLARHVEAAHEAAPARAALSTAPVGMPLGLPALSADDLRIVATWIAQGAQR